MTEKTKVQINKEWDELYQFVRNDILAYQNKALSKYFVLRLKGLSEGKFMSNKRTTPRAKYEFNEILMTFRIQKYNIISSIQDKDKFTNEQHMVNYIMVIIENNINDVVDRIKRVEESGKQGEKINTSHTETQADYMRRTKEVSNSLLDELW